MIIKVYKQDKVIFMIGNDESTMSNYFVVKVRSHSSGNDYKEEKIVGMLESGEIKKIEFPSANMISYEVYHGLNMIKRGKKIFIN